VVPRSARALFDAISRDEETDSTVSASFVEIYMERIRDLLDEGGARVSLQVREDCVRGVYVAGAVEVPALSADALLAVVSRGAANRATGATGMNEASSRSHAVLTVRVARTERVSGAARAGRLVLVDLAGSETNRATGTAGAALREAAAINKSLSALGNVINALSETGGAGHVPYRDSKLTRVLQDSLG
jgi:kinesin family protein 5